MQELIRPELISEIKNSVGFELICANQELPMFSSPHEGYAVIKEEIEEAVEESHGAAENLEVLWSVIRENGVGFESVGYIKERAVKAAAEFVQVAAMCDKYLASVRSR